MYHLGIAFSLDEKTTDMEITNKPENNMDNYDPTDRNFQRPDSDNSKLNNVNEKQETGEGDEEPDPAEEKNTAARKADSKENPKAPQND
ncbi:MAG: hypothetical protein JSS82_00930 [Bacteroidetes bacterium]|nr:hypothetical protein [Bacteroidota bacterium]